MKAAQEKMLALLLEREARTGQSQEVLKSVLGSLIQLDSVCQNLKVCHELRQAAKRGDSELSYQAVEFVRELALGIEGLSNPEAI